MTPHPVAAAAGYFRIRTRAEQHGLRHDPSGAAEQRLCETNAKRLEQHGAALLHYSYFAFDSGAISGSLSAHFDVRRSAPAFGPGSHG